MVQTRRQATYRLPSCASPSVATAQLPEKMTTKTHALSHITAKPVPTTPSQQADSAKLSSGVKGENDAVNLLCNPSAATMNGKSSAGFTLRRALLQLLADHNSTTKNKRGLSLTVRMVLEWSIYAAAATCIYTGCHCRKAARAP